MKFLRTLLLALTLAFAGSGAAHAQQVGMWEITQDSDNCSAMAPFEEGTIAYLGYFPKRDQLSVVIIDDTVFASAVSNQPFDARLAFVDNAQSRTVNARWASLPADGTVLSSGLHGVIVEGPSDALLDTFATNEFFAMVDKNNKVLVSLHMERGPEVIAALRACMAKL